MLREGPLFFPHPAHEHILQLILKAFVCFRVAKSHISSSESAFCLGAPRKKPLQIGELTAQQLVKWQSFY